MANEVPDQKTVEAWWIDYARFLVGQAEATMREEFKQIKLVLNDFASGAAVPQYEAQGSDPLSSDTVEGHYKNAHVNAEAVARYRAALEGGV